MGRTKELAQRLAASRYLAEAAQKEREEAGELLMEGKISNTTFLLRNIRSIHKDYCATNGLPFNSDKNAS